MRARRMALVMATTWKRCGHPRTPENSYKNGPGARCAKCNRAWQARNPEKHRAAQAT